MILDIWSNIREYFTNLFSKVSFSSFITLLIGIVIGALLFLLVYIIIFLNNVNKNEEKNEFDSDNIYSKEDKQNQINLINQYIKESQMEFSERSKDLTFVQKKDFAIDICKNLVEEIAKIYYPNSKYPIAELNIEEIIQLDYYIMSRIEELFDNKFLKNLKKLKISFVLDILDKKKKIEENKIVKSAKKLNVGGISQFLRNAVNVVNPVYWAKKSILDVSIKFGTDKIINIIISIIGEETAKIYSKNILNKDSFNDDYLDEINVEVEDDIDE